MSQVGGACEVQQLSLEKVSVGNASHAHGEECLSFCTQLFLHTAFAVWQDSCIRNRKYMKYFNKYIAF